MKLFDVQILVLVSEVVQGMTRLMSGSFNDAVSRTEVIELPENTYKTKGKVRGFLGSDTSLVGSFFHFNWFHPQDLIGFFPL